MTKLDTIFNITDEKKLSWWEEDIRNKPDTDKGDESTDVEEGVKDPKPDTVDKGDGKDPLTKEGGVEDPKPEDVDHNDDNNSDFEEIDTGFHQSSYHSPIDDYTEFDWPI